MQPIALHSRLFYQGTRQSSITFQRLSSSWAARVSNPTSQVQAYISTSRDPFVNLSIEHYLFQKSPPRSKVLFLYTNQPCIVIGRNQNPWLEVNLNLLQPKTTGNTTRGEPLALGNVDIVRRRSGGGTVFHDEGNVNWSVICDFTEFTRDKHAEMVVRSLRKLGLDRARVNERHDIVLDQGTCEYSVDEHDTHRTAYTSDSASRPLKVSGSAYKLSRNRALHHGTALLQSPNLNIIPHYLHSPAKHFITAKGVESVSSPVGNMGIDNIAFQDAVKSEFSITYGKLSSAALEGVDKSLLQVPEIQKGYEELKSLNWTFLQTPQFTFSNRPTHTSSIDTTKGEVFSMSVKHGVIQDCQYSLPGEQSPDSELTLFLNHRLAGKVLHEIDDWSQVLVEGPSSNKLDSLMSDIENKLPRQTWKN